MGRVRSALRAYAIEDDDPASVLTRLDRKVQHFEFNQLITVLYGILDPRSGQISISSAGHLPPIMVPACWWRNRAVTRCRSITRSG